MQLQKLILLVWCISGRADSNLEWLLPDINLIVKTELMRYSLAEGCYHLLTL